MSSAESVIEKMFMTKTARQTVVRSISRKREQIATLREELEDLNDYLNLTEARVRDDGKPRLTHAEVKRRYGIAAMNKTALNTLLNSIGKRTFVTYFQEFGDSGLSNQDIVALLQSGESFTAAASAARTSNARRIFREGLEQQALSIIVGSARVDRKVAKDARSLLAQLRSSKNTVSSAH